MEKQSGSKKKKGYVVPTKNGLFMGLIVTSRGKSNSVYANSDVYSEEKVLSWFATYYPTIEVENKSIPDIYKQWAEKIALIRNGIDQDTSNIPLDLSDYTPKQKLVIEAACRHVPINEYYTYGRVAELADLPAAHRFVGTTMKKCRQPWFIPCQRIRNSTFVKRWKAGKEPKVIKTPL